MDLQKEFAAKLHCAFITNEQHLRRICRDWADIHAICNEQPPFILHTAQASDRVVGADPNVKLRLHGDKLPQHFRSAHCWFIVDPSEGTPFDDEVLWPLVIPDKSNEVKRVFDCVHTAKCQTAGV